MQSVHPYLNFKGDAEEAFALYRSVFGGEFLGVLRFRDFGDNAMGVADADLDKIAHIALPLAEGTNLMGSDRPTSSTLRDPEGPYRVRPLRPLSWARMPPPSLRCPTPATTSRAGVTA